MGQYSLAEAQAIKDRVKVFLGDARVGTPAGGVETFLQKYQPRFAVELRHLNRGNGLKDYQLDQMASVCQVYDLVKGLNAGYTPEFVQRVHGYLGSAHSVIDEVGSKDRSFLSTRGVARARKNVVLAGNEYFWNVHLDTTRGLVEGVARIRSGEPEEKVWGTANTAFHEKLRTGTVDAGELAELVNEGLYLFRRTFVNTGIRVSRLTLSL
jgi:hypothetical protein